MRFCRRNAGCSKLPNCVNLQPNVPRPLCRMLTVSRNVRTSLPKVARVAAVAARQLRTATPAGACLH